MKILTLSSLFPNPVQPRHGIFIEHRLRNLLRTGNVESRVVAPVPWFPIGHEKLGRYAEFARVPRFDRREGVPILHPRVPILPGPGYLATPGVMAAALAGTVRNLIRDGYDFDAIDSYYLYPDGIAAVLLGQWFKRPVVMTALGSDVNLIARIALPRRMIRWAAQRAAGVTVVCRALKDRLTDIGVGEDRIHVILHGVDLDLFRPPADRAALRARLSIVRPTLLSVGNLIELKGHRFIIESLPSLPGVDLAIIGSGEERAALELLAHRLGVADRVRLLGHVDQSLLPDWYGAADALVLASSREGIPNVLMESMACGTPVIATRVGGTPEIVTTPTAGMLLPERSSGAISAAVRQFLRHPPVREATRHFAEQFSWERTSDQHLAVLDAAVGRTTGGSRTAEAGLPVPQPPS